MHIRSSFKALFFEAGKLVLFAAVLGVMANRDAAPQSPSCAGFRPAVAVRISTAGNSARVDPDRACVDAGGRITWTATDGDSWSVDFPGDDHSPLPSGQAHQAGKVGVSKGAQVRTCSTGDPAYDAAAGGCVFKYKAAHVKGGKTSTIDPDVVVKPGA